MSETHYYLPGGNATVVTLRRETDYDRNAHGNGVVVDIEVTVEELFRLILSNNNKAVRNSEMFDVLSNIVTSIEMDILPMQRPLDSRWVAVMVRGKALITQAIKGN
jgi:hypothetical protein